MVEKKDGGILLSLVGFFKKGGVGMKIGIVFAVGILLIIVAASTNNSNKNEESDSLEVKLEELCSSLVGVGKCRVMVTYTKEESRYGVKNEPRVESVAVVCRGADSATVRAELTKLLSSLYGIGTNRISISKMK